MLQADVYIKQRNHTDAFQVMGKTEPAKDETFVTWMGEDKARIDHGENMSIIVRQDKNVMYMVNHAEKKYAEMGAGGLDDILAGALSGAGLSDEEKAQAQQMMKGFGQMMKPEVTVTDTGETKKIKNWKCNKYIMETKIMMMSAISEIWATEDIKIDYELFRALGFSVVAKTPGLKDMLEEMKKIKGITVLSTSTSSAMGADVKSSQELIEVSEKSAPAGTYDVPAGYKKENE